MDYEIFDAGRFTLQCGITLPECKVAYKTHGTLAPGKDNVIVYPSRYAGTHADQTFLIGPGKALDPDKYFIICMNMLGSGLSTSPSNSPRPFSGPDFPLVTQYDNVRLQERVVREVFGIETIRLVCGWSMGGQQAFQWASLFPDRVQAMSCFCGQGTTAPHTYVFLEGVKQGIISDPDWKNGYYETPPYNGLRAKGRIWAGWALSQEWYRAKAWESQGFATLEDYLKGYWDGIYFGRDANDLLSFIATWQACDLANNPVYNGDCEAAYGAITARSIILPARTDFYFPPEDNAAEVALMPNAEMRVIDSIWGHYSGGGRTEADMAFLDQALKDLLA